MRKILLAAFLAALAAGCAPTTVTPTTAPAQILAIPEEDLALVLPGPGDTYWSPIRLPLEEDRVSEFALTHPDPRISERAFQRLEAQYRSLKLEGDTPPSTAGASEFTGPSKGTGRRRRNGLTGV